MNNKPLKSFFSAGFQALSVQILGGVFFYLLSVSLSKHEFGILNWTTAISVFITTILGFGLESVVVRRIALNRSSDWAAAAYFFHNLAGALLSFVFLSGLLLILGTDRATLRMLPWVYIMQCFIFMAMPFRQFLSAKEKFATYGVISLVSNLIKIATVFYMVNQQLINLQVVVWMLIVMSFAEFVVLLLYVKLKSKLSFSFRWTAYKKLIKESSTQYFAVLFDSSLSRIDWILIGLISAQMVLADYSFAYRAYEMLKLPAVVAGQVLLPRFARLLASGVNVSNDKRSEIQQLLKMEVVIGCFLVLIANLLWTPCVDGFSDGKYGASNANIFLLLSVCLPLHFLVNLFWTLLFSAKKYRYVTTTTVITAVANVVLNLALIPFLGGTGAAIAYLLATVLQTGVYLYFVRRKVMRCNIAPLLITLIITACAYFSATILTPNPALQILVALPVFTLLLIATRQVDREQVNIFKSFLKR